MDDHFEGIGTLARTGTTLFTSHRPIVPGTLIVQDEASNVFVLGVDYTVDSSAGAIHFLKGGPLSEAGATAQFEMNATHDAATETNSKFTGLSKPLASGSLKIVELDQFSDQRRRTIDFQGTITPTSLGENSVQDFNEFEFELLATTKPTIRHRQ